MIQFELNSTKFVIYSAQPIEMYSVSKCMVILFSVYPELENDSQVEQYIQMRVNHHIFTLQTPSLK